MHRTTEIVCNCLDKFKKTNAYYCTLTPNGYFMTGDRKGERCGHRVCLDLGRYRFCLHSDYTGKKMYMAISLNYSVGEESHFALI